MVLKDLQKNININFKNEKLLQEALTHRSYLNEHPDWPVDHNERLEFLGDAVLELIISNFLFTKFPNATEGQMTSFRAALVNYQMLGKIANDDLNLGSYLYLSSGEEKDSKKAKEVILANAFEAILGAIYIDQGYDVAKLFVHKFVLKYLDDVIEKGLYKDPKSTLQEIVQEKMKITPNYKILSARGPEHQKEFIVGVFFGDKMVAEGKGFSKQEAEMSAAANALKQIQ
ncbi:MAG: ribonuclease III [Minisyncoccia bacterium]